MVWPEVIREAGAGRVEGNPVRAHSFRSLSPSAAFHRTWSVSSVLEAATWGTTSVFALSHLRVFTTISCSSFLGSVCSGGGTDQLALTSSRLVLVDGDSSGPFFRLPCSSASSSRSCGVAYPTLHSLVANPLTFLVFPYVFSYIFVLLHGFFLIVLWLLQGTSFYRCFRHDERRGFLLDCFLLL